MTTLTARESKPSADKRDHTACRTGCESHEYRSSHCLGIKHHQVSEIRLVGRTQLQCYSDNIKSYRLQFSPDLNTVNTSTSVFTVKQLQSKTRCETKDMKTPILIFLIFNFSFLEFLQDLQEQKYQKGGVAGGNNK